jgi:hypothetical protein
VAGFNPNDYETVDSRIHRFYEAHPDGRILTQIIEIYRDDNGRPIQYIVRAEAFRDRLSTIPDATGYAEETVSISTAPKSSLLETCETSAIGRCLANLSFSPKGSRPSRTEMEKAARHEEPRPIKKAGRPANPTDDYVDASMLKYRANSLTPDEKKQLLEAWPAKLAKPIPDRIPPSVARELEEVLDAITRGVKPAATDPDPCATCGLAPTCPLGAAGETDPQCRHYNPEGEEA